VRGSPLYEIARAGGESKFMHPYIIPISKQFIAASDEKNAAWMTGYMLNQFEYYGLKTPIRKKLSKEYIKEKPVLQA